MEEPAVSFIILADRPAHLRVLLAALAVQTDQRWEALVLAQDNRHGVMEVVRQQNDLLNDRTKLSVTLVDRVGDWGQTVKLAAVQRARGKYLAFPNDDAYYCPRFVEVMLQFADDMRFDLVYCDWVFDKYGYMTYKGAPQVGMLDVGGFIVNRDWVHEGTWDAKDDTGDGKMIEKIVRLGAQHVRCPHTLYVKN